MFNTFIVVDADPHRKAAVARMLAGCGYVIPVDCIDDVGPRWPENAWLLASSDDGIADEALLRLAELGKFYPLVIYGEALSVERIGSLLHNGLIGTLPLPFTAEAAATCFARLEPIADRLRRIHFEGREALRRIAALSAREEEVMRLVSQGLSNKEVSLALGISPRTVEIHRASAIAKLAVPNSFAAARLFFQAHLASPLQGFGSATPVSIPLAA